MKILRIYLLLLIVTPIISFSQTDDSWKIYDDTQVAKIEITVDKSKLEWIYKNVQSDSEHVAKVRFTNKHFDETIDSIGFRLRGNTSRVSAKKSLKISFNSFIKGKKFHGVEKLNLNGEHNDPSIVRSKISFDHFNNLKIPSSRANHTEVYINGSYYGLYINVEHVDDEFLKKNFKDFSGNLWKCLWPADLTFKGKDQSSYINLNSDGRFVYELKTNESQMDFSKLANFIDLLNNTPDSTFADSIETVLNVSSVLKYFAVNVLIGSWDDYWANMNNYYFYHNPSEDKFYIIPYDYDNTFGISWTSNDWTNSNPYNFPGTTNTSRPLATRLMKNDSYRNLYTHFLEFFISKSVKLELWETKLDSLKKLISSSAERDTFRTKDYNFSMNDFNNSYSESYSNKHVKTGIKQFVNARLNSVKNQIAYKSSNPIAYKIDYQPKIPKSSDTIFVTVSAFSNVGLNDVSIKLKRSGATSVEYLKMNFSPVLNSNNVEEQDRFTGKIFPLGNNSSASFSILVKDSENKTVEFPRKSEINISTSNTLSNEIVINEFLADNVNSQTDANGDHDDWVELYNNSNKTIDLSGKYLTDSPSNLKKWRFTQTNLTLSPNQFLVVWCDESPTQTGIHAGFKLSKGGEFIALVDTNGVLILDSLSFGPQKTDTSYGRFPNGSPTWNNLKPTPGFSNTITKIKLETSPKVFSLSQNYPNPFNSGTVINYNLPKSDFVTLKLFDLLGKEIKTFVNEFQSAGSHQLKINSLDLPTGIYIYKLQSASKTEYKQMMLLK